MPNGQNGFALRNKGFGSECPKWPIWRLKPDLPLPASFDVLLAPKHAIQSCNLLS